MSDQTNAFEMFKKMQQNSGANALKELQDQMEAENESVDYTDERMYYPERDDKGNAAVKIRFLSGAANSTGGMDPKYIQTFKHNFKVNDQWFIYPCMTTTDTGSKKGTQIGKCPVCESNDVLWKQGEKSEGRLLVSGENGKNGRKRRMNYLVNVLVVDDPANPEKNGKVFLMNVGKKVMDMIDAAGLDDVMEDTKGFSAFDMFEGATFLYRIRYLEGQTNYDTSKFLKAGPMHDKTGKVYSSDEAMEIWQSAYPLVEDYLGKLNYGGDENTSNYDAQKARLDLVLGNTSNPTDNASTVAQSGGASQSNAPVESSSSGEPDLDALMGDLDDL